MDDRLRSLNFYESFLQMPSSSSNITPLILFMFDSLSVSIAGASLIALNRSLMTMGDDLIPQNLSSVIVDVVVGRVMILANKGRDFSPSSLLE
jgi:hypothetical protein